MSEENINTGTAEFNINGIAAVNETLLLVNKKVIILMEMENFLTNGNHLLMV